MKRYNKADSILCLAFFIFLLFFVIHRYFPGDFVAGLCLASAEAALIGGLADWFAVTALFKKPLGFSWHTALIPRHRDKLTAGVREMVEGNLLSSESIRHHLAEIRLVDYIIAFVEKDKKFVITVLLGYGQKLCREFGSQDNIEVIAAKLKKLATTTNMLPHYQLLLAWLYQSKKVDEAIDKLLDKLLILAEQPKFRDYLAQLVQEYSQPKAIKQPESVWDFLKGAAAKFLLNAAETADIFNPGEIAAILQQELIDILVAAKQPDALLRQVLFDGFNGISRQLSEDARLQGDLNRWHKGVMAELDLTAFLQAVLKSLESAVSPDGAAASLLTVWLTERLQKYWHIFINSNTMQDWLEEYLQRGVGRLAAAQQGFIGQIVVEALTSLTDEELNQFVLDKAGHDLAWIRINGSVVGAIVGAGIFLFTHEVYMPYIIPLIRTFSAF